MSMLVLCDRCQQVMQASCAVYSLHNNGTSKHDRHYCMSCIRLASIDRSAVCVICGNWYDAHKRLPRAGLCSECRAGEFAREWARVRIAIGRARWHKSDATLTLAQWIGTLENFRYRCAYCDGLYQALEHYISLVMGGGTTSINCVPACKTCNNVKGYALPEDVIEHGRRIAPAALVRVGAYLATQMMPV